MSTTWPHRAGGMADCIRAFDWSQTSLGPIESWSSRLQLMVELVLANPLVSSLTCGPERLLLYNDAAARLYGDRHPAALGRPLPEAFPEGWPTVALLYERAFAGETVQVDAQPLDTRGEGQAVDVFEAILTPVRDETGSVVFVHMVGREIGSRLRAEAALQESEDHLRTVLEGIDELFYALDRDCRFLFASQSALQLWGKDAGELLGRPFLEAFPEAAGSQAYEAHRRVIRTGEAERLETLSPEMHRWIEINFTPTSQGGLSVAFREIEARKQAERRQTFLLRLSDALRPLSDSAEMERTAMRMLGEELGVERAFFATVEADGESWSIRSDHTNGVPSLAGRYPMSEFKRRRLPQWQAGRVSSVADSQTDPGFDAVDRAAYAAFGARAAIGVPLVKGGRFAALLSVNQTEPRVWSEADLALTSETAERTWAAIERARAEEALQESEVRHRLLIGSWAQAMWETDADGVVIADSPSWRAYAGQTLEEWLGYGWLDAIHPDDRAYAERQWREAIADRRPVDAEFRLRAPDGGWRWTNVRAAPMLDAEGNIEKWAGMNVDIDARKRVETNLRAAEERQAYLLELNDALRPLSDPTEIQHEAMRVLGRRLGVSRAQYYLADETGEYLLSSGGYTDGVPAAVGRFRLIEFGQYAYDGLHAGETQVVCDATSDPRISETVLRSYGEVGFLAYIGVPFTQRGRLIGTVAVHQAEPRQWTDNERHMVEETAECAGIAVAQARAEQALRESEARFRALVTAGGNSIYRMSPDWRSMYQLDSTTLAVTSAPIENWVEKYIPDEDLPRVRAAIDEAIRTRSLFELEHRVRLADGSIGSVLSRAVPLIGPDGMISEWFGAGSDVTERRTAIERLRESEEAHRIDLERQVQERTAELKDSRDLLQGTMDSSTDMIQVFEAVRGGDGRIVDFRWILNNHTSESQYGDVLGRSLVASNPGVIEEGIFDAFERVVETGKSDQSERHYVHEQFDGWFLQSAVKLGDGVATTTKDITDWKAAHAEVLRLRDEAAQARLRESEERLRDFGEASTDVLWIRDVETLNWTYLTPAFETIYGMGRDEALAGNNFRNWVELIVPDDRQHAVAMIGRVRDGERVTFEYRIRRPSDGAIRWLRNTDFPIRDVHGRVTAIGGVGHDASQEKEADRTIRASRRQMRTLIEGVPQLVWRGVDGGEWTWSSPQWTAFTGLSEAASTGRGWLAAIHPDDHERAMDAWRRAEATEEPLEVEYRIRQAGDDGGYRWFQTRALPVRDEETGRVFEWLGTSTDVDDMRTLQEEQTVMVAELQHRTRNLIAVVSSIARQTMAQTGPTKDFQIEFKDRLEALSRVQGLLSQAGEDRITIGDVVEMELNALGSAFLRDRVTIDGPDVSLRKSIVQTLALAIHELATNARKYGALSNGHGELAVRWTTNQTDHAERRMFLEWIEHGVEVKFVDGGAIVQGGGYGRQLIEKSLPYSLKAKTTYELEPDGLRCTIDLPLGTSRTRSRPA